MAIREIQQEGVLLDVDAWYKDIDIQAKEIRELVDIVSDVQLPPDLVVRVQRLIESLNRGYGQPGYNASYDRTQRYIEWITALPWFERSEDNLDIDKARDILDETHYGLESIKKRILEYIAILKLQKEAEEDQNRAQLLKQELRQGRQAVPVLFFVGLPGIGKTSIAYTIARALNRKFVRVAMGGMGSALQLRGESRVNIEAEPGQVIKGLRQAGTRNPVILLDEIDRTAEEARAQIMGVLLELLDPEQNFAFTDYYIDHPFDLSNVLFLASANNTGGIANAVLDRMELIKMPGYNDEEKVIIARDYLLPRQLRVTGMPEEAIEFAPEVWEAIVRPLGYDAGIRSMERTVNAVVRNAALRRVEGRGDHFVITLENLNEFMPDMAI